MKITMTKTTDGSEDGIHVNKFIQGTVYDIKESLAKAFISIDAAVVYVEPVVEPEVKVEEKKSPAPENKAVTPSFNKKKENKDNKEDKK